MILGTNGMDFHVLTGLTWLICIYFNDYLVFLYTLFFIKERSEAQKRKLQCNWGVEIKRWPQWSRGCTWITKRVIHEGLFNKEMIGSLHTIWQIRGYFSFVKHHKFCQIIYGGEHAYSIYNIMFAFPFLFGA